MNDHSRDLKMAF